MPKNRGPPHDPAFCFVYRGDSTNLQALKGEARVKLFSHNTRMWEKFFPFFYVTSIAREGRRSVNARL